MPRTCWRGPIACARRSPGFAIMEAKSCSRCASGPDTPGPHPAARARWDLWILRITSDGSGRAGAVADRGHAPGKLASGGEPASHDERERAGLQRARARERPPPVDQKLDRPIMRYQGYGCLDIRRKAEDGACLVHPAIADKDRV